MISRGLRIGCASWSLPRACAERFPPEGTHLERYAGVLNAVEINTTFHRLPRRTTWERWASAVPEAFRFAVKAPREITHVRRLQDCEAPLHGFLEDARVLGERLGPILIQLPPSLAFDAAAAAAFFDVFRTLHRGPVACEPRHASWFDPAATRLLAAAGVARVAADPEPVPGAGTPGGWSGLAYYRQHGSPRRYYSAYGAAALAALAPALIARARHAEVWCIFDNTAAGAATGDALALAGICAGS
ncbi:MAG: DUF72 domain-containing protein [Candidatus Methylomirabilales bacterium]